MENRLLSSIHKQGVNLKRLKQELNELKNEIELMRKHNYTMMNDIEDLQVHELREEIVNLAEQQQLLQEAMLRDQVQLSFQAEVQTHVTYEQPESGSPGSATIAIL